MAKSPYELRTELLNMAMQLLIQEREAAANQADLDRYKETAELVRVGVTQPITTEEVIAEARKLNNFIQEKGDLPPRR